MALILLIVYRSPLLWLFPLFGAVGAIVVAQAAAHGLANAGLTVSTLSADILIVLVFGAASDYALLLVHRYREELRRHATTEAAMATTLRAPRCRPWPPSAATVTCAMICLLVADSASLHGLGPVGAIGIVAALLAQTTFLPALLLVVGRFAFWPRIPRQGAAGREESRIWAGIGARITAIPCGPWSWSCWCSARPAAASRRCGSTTTRWTTSRAIQAAWSARNCLPSTTRRAPSRRWVLLAPAGQAAPAAAAARATPGVGSVVPGAPVEGYDSYSVVLSVPPYGSAGTTALVDLRQRLSQDAPGSLVGGQRAIQYDAAQSAGRATR